MLQILQTSLLSATAAQMGSFSRGTAANAKPAKQKENVGREKSLYFVLCTLYFVLIAFVEGQNRVSTVDSCWI